MRDRPTDLEVSAWWISAERALRRREDSVVLDRLRAELAAAREEELRLAARDRGPCSTCTEPADLCEACASRRFRHREPAAIRRGAFREIREHLRRRDLTMVELIDLVEAGAR